MKMSNVPDSVKNESKVETLLFNNNVKSDDEQILNNNENCASSSSATVELSVEDMEVNVSQSDVFRTEYGMKSTASTNNENSEVVSAEIMNIPHIEFDAAVSTDDWNENVSSDKKHEFSSGEDQLRPQQRFRSNSVVEYDLAIPFRSTQYEVNKYPLVQDYTHEREPFMISSPTLPHDEYQKMSTEPGEIFIYNFENFDNAKPRRGSRIDVKALVDTLGRLKFNIIKGRIYSDLTTAEVITSIQGAIAGFDSNSKINCLMVFFLSHGETQNAIATRDGTLVVEDIIKSFNCDALEDVPKWFTFLACKEPKGAESHKYKIVADQTFLHRLPDDVIIYYSTTEGNLSARVPEEGSWVIQELCRNMNAYGRRDELFSILTRTNKCIANNYVTPRDEIVLHRQCPVIVSTLTRKFFLTSSKERMAQLAIHNKIKEIREECTNMNQ